MTPREWGRFGEDDRRGALNFVDSAKVLAAMTAVRTGEVFSLSLPMDIPPVAASGRPPLRRSARNHNQLRHMPDGRFAVVNDDVVEFAPQGGSHWDSFAHFGVIDPESEGIFYGGADLSETTPEPRAKRLGIDAFAGGIVTRGVVVDLVAGLADGAGYLRDDASVNRGDVERCLAAQGVELVRGDVALLFTGYERRVGAMGVGARVPGVDRSTVPLWIECEVTGIASDNLAVESFPLDYSLHAGALRDAGILLGELWALERLVEACRSDGVYECLLMSAPLNMPGAFGSPANALAVR